MENQIERKLEHELETWITWWLALPGILSEGRVQVVRRSQTRSSDHVPHTSERSPVTQPGIGLTANPRPLYLT